ncbi:MAG: KpsF/GutQ family sugar-phosphate isomerase [Paludibacteraceae bacterium]|nr:KpsF/GutQ family sugar-phosphate isomerase [Paludibacteraceae bacterium]
MTYSDQAKHIFDQEIAELTKLRNSINGDFDEVVEAIAHCKGKLVLMGIGKTGIIGHKIASSMASTGTQAIFVNAAEAVHGDLGMISKNDVVMLVSNSGSTQEILNVIAPLRKIGCKLIAMTGNKTSPLAKDSDLVLSVHIDNEVCPLGLAPTTSTTATLLMGDALMVVLMELHHFKAENFAIYHPGGALGRQLNGKVINHMTRNIPKVQTNTPFRAILPEMSDKHLGMTMVYEGDKAVGIITDGDVRRAIVRTRDIDQLRAKDFMSKTFKRISQETLLTDALAMMDEFNITTLAVTENEQSTEIIGIISIHHIIDFN